MGKQSNKVEKRRRRVGYLKRRRTVAKTKAAKPEAPAAGANGIAGKHKA
jgi:hypothetical protein